jgi:predicted Zn-dependent protease
LAKFPRPVVAAFLLFASCVTAFAGARDPRIEPALYQHLDYAEQMVEHGAFQRATSHAKLVLLPEAITVRIESNGVSSDQTDRAKRALERALDTWSGSLSGLSFRIVSGPADVVVSIQNLARLNGQAVAGKMTWERRSLGNDYQMTCRMAISTRSPGGSALSEAVMTQAALHEFGHVLGLADDYDGPGVMSRVHLRSPVTTPSLAELASLRRLRDQAQSILLSAVAGE